MAKQLMPRADLEPRPTDFALSPAQYLELSLFARLKRKPSLDKFPGTVVVRRYKAGDAICRQGEAGWTAFYLLSAEDVLALHRARLAAAKADTARRSLLPLVASQFLRVQQLANLPPNHAEREAANVHLAVPAPPAPPQPGWLDRARHALARWSREQPPARQFIPFDGPTEIAYDTRQAVMYEGELFGEMSCLHRTPRSATVIATRDCYVLEMLRNILDQLQKDPSFKEYLEGIYRQRVLGTHLRQLALFSDVPESVLDEIRGEVELVTCEPGTLLFDEHDRPDSVYVIRRGLVRVQKGASALLSADQVVNWADLWAAVRTGPEIPRGALRTLWRAIPEDARVLIAEPDPRRLTEIERQTFLDGLNALLKRPDFYKYRAFRATRRARAFRRRTRKLRRGRKTWSESDLRAFNRLLLESMLPGLTAYRGDRPPGPVTLTYCSRGELIGEVSLMTGQARTATCTAYGHAVELVKLPEALFRDLLDLSRKTRGRLWSEVTRRQQRSTASRKLPPWEEAGRNVFAGEADRLGLVQGQHLMLIDLEACTRCDECVRACANAHPDGRSRVFLQGPKFDRFLVPATCRSCLDPVCMIGCPVGSIHRGAGGEIRIEDWCIGCSLCADQCPYDAIQMHDVGLIPEDSRGWRFEAASRVGPTAWYAPRFRAARWPTGVGPVRHDAAVRKTLADADPAQGVCFRHPFSLPPERLVSGSSFKLIVTTAAAEASVWVNGREVVGEKPKGNKREFWLPPKPAAKDAPRPSLTEWLRPGVNLLAVLIKPLPPAGELVVQARLDEVRTLDPGPDEVTQVLVTHNAVVCDLCATTTGKPACVEVCPHDAAIRLDGRYQLPFVGQFPGGRGR